MVAERPQVLHGVGAPRAPSLGVCDEPGAGRQADRLRELYDAEVVGEEGVRVAERAHGDGLDGPRSDAWNGLQLRACCCPVGPGVEVDATVGQCSRELKEGPPSR